MERILITGANRGIGYEFVRQYLQRDNTRLFAACRTPDTATGLQQLAAQHPDRLTVVQMDVIDKDSIIAAEKTVAAQVDGLDLLINNAAINPSGQQGFATISQETMLNVLNVNVVGPLLVTQVFVDLLKAGNNPRLVNISSQMGSLERRDNGGPYAYCSSKAALNMVTRSLAADLKIHDIISVMTHPGWVRTDMGGSGAPLSTEESTQGLIQLFDRLTMKDNSQFYQWDGESLPW
jgi:NAD(P)-dependent dehydrogenase (short-subunit alcohol dehydrogenase family)